MPTRDQELFPLFANATALPGVGARIVKLVEKIAGTKVIDLVWHLPSGIIDRRYAPKVGDAAPESIATLTVEVLSHFAPPPRNKRVPYKVICGDNTGDITLTFFHSNHDYLRRMLPVGERRVISGRIDLYDRQRQMSHPDHIVGESEASNIKKVEALYPLTAGLSPKTLRKAITAAIKLCPNLAEWHDPEYLAKQNWPNWKEAIQESHSPKDESDLIHSAPARMRLAYDELLSNQLALALVRHRARRLKGRSAKGDGSLRSKVLETLPYQLTGAQKRTMSEIETDMKSSTRMLRLLQGDVGSGKTIVAMFAILGAVESGGQAALMAPTEILAQQHYETLKPLAETAGVRIEFLSGRHKGKERSKCLAALIDGDIDLIVGTHALFQKEVLYKKLVFVVIDEQHRFGVHQRLELTDKGEAIDVLVMTATPIPRTLTLTVYGDMDVSRLDEKPPGRSTMTTRLVNLDRLPEITTALQRAVDKEAKAFWVCPLVEESEKSDLAAVDKRYAHLKEVLRCPVALIHGRMKPADKDELMASFASTDKKSPKVLVATTVIEVGVNVPDATIMVVEHAERFGLSQLHQLRGRIGRGAKPSACLLLYSTPLTELARNRLRIIRDTQDGFVIAEQDLILRGSGELLGTRQSGLQDFRLADIALHSQLLQTARDDTKMIIEQDPNLATHRGKALRTLLYLFEQDSAIRTLRSG